MIKAWGTGRVPWASVSPPTWIALTIGLAAVLVALSMRIAIAWLDAEMLAGRVLPDDAFYYFETADRVGRGQNVSFDGLHVSNGYHPLWLFTLVPIYLLPGSSLPLHVALTLASILDVTAAVITGISVLRLTRNAFAALFALVVYLFIPRNIFSAVNGVESSLAAVFVALLLLLIVEWYRTDRRTVRRAALMGLAGGFMVLSRLDSAPVFAAALLLMIWPAEPPRQWRNMALAAVVGAAIIAPWFIWSAIEIGTAAPVSAASPTLAFKAIYDGGHRGANELDHLRHGLHLTRVLLETRIPALYFPDRTFSVAFITLLVCLAAHHLVSRGAGRRRYWTQLAIAGLPIAAFGLTLFVNSAYRWNVREWYFAWAMPCGVLLFGIAFSYADDVIASVLERMEYQGALTEAARPLVLWAVLVSALGFAYAELGRDQWAIGVYPFQRDALAAAAYINANTEPDTRIASFNAGAIGYFTDRTVINIDGVVNEGAYRALQDRRLLAYLREEDVRYVADYDAYWTRLPGYLVADGDWTRSLWGEDPSRGFRLIAGLGPPGLFGQMQIYEVLPKPETESRGHR